MATQAATLLTFEEYADLPEKEGVFQELDEGVLIEMSTPSHAHGALQGNAFSLLSMHRKQTGADYVITRNAGFRLGPNTVRGPDVCLVRRASFRAMERVRGGYRQGGPDLAVEVVSESETAVRLTRKIEQYLAAGTSSVWLIYADPPQVIVHRRSGEIQKFTAGQRFQEPELLPGLVIPVDELFVGVEGL